MSAWWQHYPLWPRRTHELREQVMTLRKENDALLCEIDDLEWENKGIAEWREAAMTARRELAAAKARADHVEEQTTKICIVKDELARDLAAAKAVVREARQELPPTVEANQPEYADLLARMDAIAGSKT